MPGPAKRFLPEPRHTQGLGTYMPPVNSMPPPAPAVVSKPEDVQVIATLLPGYPPDMLPKEGQEFLYCGYIYRCTKLMVIGEETTMELKKIKAAL